jgi:hypothetical protein
MDNLVFWIEVVLHFSHEFKRQMAIVENNPVTGLETILDLGESGAFHFFSHRGLLGGEFLEFPREVINISGRISTSR